MDQEKQLDDATEQFMLSVAYILLFPLVPVLLEYASSGSVTGKTLALAAGFYAITIGVVSERPTTFLIGVFFAIFWAFEFGTMKDDTASTTYSVAAWLNIACVVILHSCERYKRHFINKRPFVTLRFHG